MDTFSMVKMICGIVQTLHFHSGCFRGVDLLLGVVWLVNVGKFYGSSPQTQNYPRFQPLQTGTTRSCDFGSVPKIRNYSGNVAFF